MPKFSWGSCVRMLAKLLDMLHIFLVHLFLDVRLGEWDCVVWICSAGFDNCVWYFKFLFEASWGKG